MNSQMYMMHEHYLPREQTSYNPNDSRLALVPHSLDPLVLGMGALDTSAVSDAHLALEVSILHIINN